jgi:acyl-CoA synthetase (AMP-forming)/AMP-acid ligase II
VKDAQAQLDEAAVIEWARDKMANYKVPRSVIFLDELPMNAGGKVDKAVLLKQSAQAQP